MTSPQPDGRHMNEGPPDHGAVLYTVTLQFSDGFLDRNDRQPTDNPWHWDWANLIDQPDARVIGVAETPNPHYGRVGLDDLSLAVGALRDYDAAVATGQDRLDASGDDDSLLVDAAVNYASVLADNVRGLLRSLGVTA